MSAMSPLCAHKRTWTKNHQWSIYQETTTTWPVPLVMNSCMSLREDYLTNIHHTLKKKPLRFEDLRFDAVLLRFTAAESSRGESA